MNTLFVAKFVSRTVARTVFVFLFTFVLFCLSADSVAQAPKQSVSWQQDALTKRMIEETGQWNMLQVDGLPIVGESSYLRNAMKETQGITPMSFSLQRNKIHERILVTYLPKLTASGQDPKQLLDLLPVYEGLLGHDVMTRYLNQNHSDWLGDDEFARRDNFVRFHTEQAKQLQAAIFPPPYRVRTIRRVSVEKYDFDNMQFQLTSGEFKKPQNIFLRLNHPSLGSSSKVDLANQLKVAFPFYWPMPPDEAREMSKRLRNENRRTGRYVYLSSVFDIFDQAYVPTEKTPSVTQVDSIKELQHHFLSKHVESALYLDPFLKNRVWSIPIRQPKSSFLLEPDSSSPHPSSTPTPCPLWQRDVMMSLLDTENPDAATLEDWAIAALENWQRDYEYYDEQQVFSYNLNDSTQRKLRRMSLEDTNSSVHPQLHDLGYQPFFPNGQFRGPRIALESMVSRLNEVTLSSLKNYATQKVQRSDGLFSIPIQLGVNLAEGQGKIIHNSYAKWGIRDVRDFKEQKDVGLVVKAEALSKGGNLELQAPSKHQHFAFSYPAISAKLIFKLDTSAVPADVKPVEREDSWDIYSGQLVVKTGGVRSETITNSEDNLRYRIIDVIPVRFECHHQAGTDKLSDQALAKVGQLAFQLPVDIAPYSLGTHLATQEQEKAKLKEKQRKKNKKKYDAIQEQIQREKAEKNRRFLERWAKEKEAEKSRLEAEQ